MPSLEPGIEIADLFRRKSKTCSLRRGHSQGFPRFTTRRRETQCAIIDLILLIATFP
jgi:hypothetical protein